MNKSQVMILQSLHLIRSVLESLRQLFVRSTTQRRGFLPRNRSGQRGFPRRRICGLIYGRALPAWLL